MLYCLAERINYVDFEGRCRHCGGGVEEIVQEDCG